MIRLLVIALATLSFTTVGLQVTEVSARACKRVCMGGDCWYDCSKLPGQKY